MTTRTLLHANGTPVKVGDEVTSFRDEKYIVTGWPDNRNRVWVREPDSTREDEFFPSVFNLKWEDEQ